MDEVTINRIMNSAVGYIELGMFDEAAGEVDRLPAELIELPAALRIRLVLAVKSGDWEAGAGLGRRLVESGGGTVDDHMQAAYCLHELRRTGEARAILLGAPVQAQNNAVCLYNLACYEAVLGRHEQALEHLDKAASIDPDVRRMALQDPDLASLRSHLKPEG